MKLSIILVSYNTHEITLQAVAAVLNELSRSETLHRSAEVIVVDNHSTDGSLEALKKLANNNQIKLLSNQANVGFAAANNLGISQAKGQYYLLLNSDTIVQPGALDHLVATLDQASINEVTAYSAAHQHKLDRLGIVAATLLNPDGSLQPQGGSFPSLVSLAVHMLFLDDLPLIGRWLPSTQFTGRNTHQQLVTNLPDSATTPVVPQDWVGGAAMLIRKEVIDEIGLLDEHIFMYGEDVEFCLRAHDHHWDVGIVPTAKIVHLGSASSSSARAIEGELQGYIYIWSKHRPLWQLPVVRVILKLGCVLRWFFFGTMFKQPVKAEVYSQIWRRL